MTSYRIISYIKCTSIIDLNERNLHAWPGDGVDLNVCTYRKFQEGSLRVIRRDTQEEIETSFTFNGFHKETNVIRGVYTISFVMPPSDIEVHADFTGDWSGEDVAEIQKLIGDVTKMDIQDKKERVTNVRQVTSDEIVDTFTIPEDVAQRLSDLLVKQSIRQGLLPALIGEPDAYEKAEALLIPIQVEIDKIKYEISTRHVPVQYRSSKYKWNYNGWEIDNNVVEILYA
ncbi:MAG: hypothetical protein NC131_11335 [Roseburia sp.]|nr:hypothetical protein [Roseburia sp.]